jgi:hypothetical protein
MPTNPKPSSYPLVIVVIVLLAVGGPPLAHFLVHSWRKYVEGIPENVAKKP